MNCPKCAGKLQKRSFQGEELDSCFVCEGLWFDAGELEQVIKKDSRNFDFLGLEHKDLDGNEVGGISHQLDNKQGECPRCADGTQLNREPCQYNKDVTVDICPKGHGVWLDGGEIKHLRKRFLAELKERAEFCFNFIKYCYSLKGIKEMASSIRNKPKE